MLKLTGRMKNLTGVAKGRLTALYPSHKDVQNAVIWEFSCECGNTHTARGSDFSAGKVLSCGCYQTESRFTHGLSKSKEYGVWRGIKYRCYESTREHEVRNYQDRGITMSDDWKNSFEAFYKDMGAIPDGYDIDRIDNNLGYFKENCRLVPRKINQQNKRESYIWSYDGKDYGSAQDLADVLGVNADCIFKRTLGYTHNETSKFYPPKEGYSRRLKYESEESNAETQS